MDGAIGARRCPCASEAGSGQPALVFHRWRRRDHVPSTVQRMSASFSLDTSGLERRLATVRRNVPKVAAKVLTQAGQQLKRDVRAAAPKRTGRLRGSVRGPKVTWDRNLAEAVVQVLAEYARFVDARRPFVAAATRSAQASIPQRMERALRSIG